MADIRALLLPPGDGGHDLLSHVCPRHPIIIARLGSHEVKGILKLD